MTPSAALALPRLCFGLGSLMAWAPGHTHPLPTDSYAQVAAALAAGFRHFDCGDLYTNLPSAIRAIRDAGVPRDQLCLSLKLNTYGALKPARRDDMVASAKKVLREFGWDKHDGYLDVALLHFPPRAKGDNLSNREAWAVLEELKDEGLVRVIGVSNWTIDDYESQFAHNDIKHLPQVSEYELNPHLLFDPKFKARAAFEREHGIVPKYYGILTPVTDRLAKRSASPHLLATLDELSIETGLTPHEILLLWASQLDISGTSPIITTSTSNAERAKRLVQLLGDTNQDDDDSGKSGLDKSVYERLEHAAGQDGYEGKTFYLHPHMNK
ncbi:NADP-dependent oxidoreductase domain-containing protein [Coniella lustricola]|uniref:NADP-dependent oxidoreductase domain-containing protein n=1 Tax=Coniella lustricola TaxID=2025994 RepID=A0A2T2ZVX9_9PEZI|nr:NADP-dependent oxidoreductase domain-containing protein [Coniella lustricola]